MSCDSTIDKYTDHIAKDYFCILVNTYCSNEKISSKLILTFNFIFKQIDRDFVLSLWNHSYSNFRSNFSFCKYLDNGWFFEKNTFIQNLLSSLSTIDGMIQKYLFLRERKEKEKKKRKILIDDVELVSNDNGHSRLFKAIEWVCNCLTILIIFLCL